MLAFIIPVKSKTVTSDWTHFSNLVNRCISSLCNQANKDFKILVACHEIPITDFNNDSRVEFLQADFPSPILQKNADDKWLKEFDKGKKLKLAAAHAITIGASYVMTVDSDDCISNKISGFVAKNKDHSILGWYVKKGYLYREGKSYAFLNLKNYNTLCGSSVIIKPAQIDLMYSKEFWFKHERISFKDNLSLVPIPFPGSLYSLANGTNIVSSRKEMKIRTTYNPSKLDSLKTLFRRLSKYIIVPTFLIKNEFNLTLVHLNSDSVDDNN